MSHRSSGLLVALLVLLAEQATKKLFVLGGMFVLEGAKPIELTSWLELFLTWNPGISYSLFSADSAAGRLALLAFSGLAVVALSIWLYRTRRLIACAGLGAILGGALGNAANRAMYGKVVDFIHVHIGAFSPFGVFNIADMAIFAGVALLLYDELFVKAAAAHDGGASKSP